MGEQQKNAQEPDLNQLRKVRREKLADLQANGKDPFVITKYEQSHHSQEIKEHFEELEGKQVSIAGRMMSKRVMGKASFCNVQDLQGNIQSYVARDSVGEEAYKDFKKFDVGDVIGIKGEVFRTKTGEMSIHAAEITLLSKSADPPGEVPWADEYRSALPSEICGSDHESGRKRYIYQAFQNLACDPEISGRRGIYGSGDSDARGKCGRSRCKTVRDTF